VTLAIHVSRIASIGAVECGVWAIAYTKLGALPAPAEALDGVLLFGISAAFLFAAMAPLWRYQTQT